MTRNLIDAELRLRCGIFFARICAEVFDMYRRIFICAILLIGLCLLGCGGSKDDSPIQATLQGGTTKLTLPLPFDVKNPPTDEKGTLPPEAQNVISKAERYQAGDNGLFLTASYSTFPNGFFERLSEEEIYDALNGELQINLNQMESNGQFSNLQLTQNQTKIDGNPALIVTATYIFKKQNYKSTLVYTLHGQDFWRLVFDYLESDAKAVNAADKAVAGIKIQ